MDTLQYDVRIRSRYDVESDWDAIDPVLLEGEIAVVHSKSDIPNSLPEIRFKCGDGVHNYSELPFVSALALDVYKWAKQKDKPSYTAAEIAGLTEFIQNIQQAFPPIAHRHSTDDINGLLEFVRNNSGGGGTSGGDQSGPQLGEHNHLPEEIIGLTEFITAIHDSLGIPEHFHELPDHSHVTSNIIGLQSYIQDIVNSILSQATLAPSKHTHTIDDIEGLREELDKKAEGGNTGSDDTGNDDNSTNNTPSIDVVAKDGGGLRIELSANDPNERIISIDNRETFILDGGTSAQFRL